MSSKAEFELFSVVGMTVMIITDLLLAYYRRKQNERHIEYVK